MNSSELDNHTHYLVEHPVFVVVDTAYDLEISFHERSCQFASEFGVDSESRRSIIEHVKFVGLREYGSGMVLSQIDPANYSDNFIFYLSNIKC